MGMGVPYIPLRCTLSLVGCERCYFRGDITISGILTLGTRWSVLVTLVTLKREISLGDFFEIRQVSKCMRNKIVSKVQRN